MKIRDRNVEVNPHHLSLNHALMIGEQLLTTSSIARLVKKGHKEGLSFSEQYELIDEIKKQLQIPTPPCPTDPAGQALILTVTGRIIAHSNLGTALRCTYVVDKQGYWLIVVDDLTDIPPGDWLVFTAEVRRDVTLKTFGYCTNVKKRV